MHPLRIAFLFAALAPALGVAGPSSLSGEANPPDEPGKRYGEFVFSLWPKAFQKNPRLEFNVVTEMSSAGRKLPPPTRQNPVYYVAQAGQPINSGLLGPEGKLDSSAGPSLHAALNRVLGENGYREVDEGHPATLVIIYQFGSYAFNPPTSVTETIPDGVDNPPASSIQPGDVAVSERDIRRVLLNRASLLGGRKFLMQVAEAMDEVDHKAALERNFIAPDGGEGFMGSVGAILPEPFERLRVQSAEMERLVDELFSSSYFVVASAYDYQALAKGQRRLLWRTKMTVNSLGVNLAESLPPLLASAGPYLGRETRDPVLITKRISRDGRVEVGTPEMR
jgi:hypothetical protein